MSNIEWTEETWNPTVGCDKVSAGCKNCYAIKEAWKLMHNPNPAIKEKYRCTVEKTAGGDLNWTGRINLNEPSLLKPLQAKKPTVYFVDSMSDLFHEGIPFEFIDKVFAVMALCPQHIFQVLTKRPQRMLEYMKSREQELSYIDEAAEIIATTYPHLCYEKEFFEFEGKKDFIISNQLFQHLKDSGWYSACTPVDLGNEDYENELEFIYEGQFPFPNVWLGTSVEDQAAADERIPLLLQTPAHIRFLSCEPLLGPLNLVQLGLHNAKDCGCENHSDFCPYNPHAIEGKKDDPNTHKIWNKLDWVICGGESGNKARPMHPDWARSIRDQCQAAGVAFFFKQWGAWAPSDEVDPSHDITAEHRFINNYICITRAGQTSKIANELTFEEGEENCILYKFGKHISGRSLDGREWNEYPAYTKKNSEPVNQNVTKS